MRDLEFEKPLLELYKKIEELRRLYDKGDAELEEELCKIEKKAELMSKEIYDNLTPSQILQLARHPNRPDSTTLMSLMSDKYYSMHGDRLYRDDPSIVGGLVSIGDASMMFIGHQKGHDTKENLSCNFGMPHPEGYRKALRLMTFADKFRLPIITFIDTPGAFPGMEAESRGQASAIANNLKAMAGISVPIIAFIIGEGGSGGALGIGMSNKLYMLEYSVYSVISPEGCASILFRDASKASFAAKSLKITSSDLVSFGIVDDVIKEPIGGAHHDWQGVANSIKKKIMEDIAHYESIEASQVKEERYQKYRNIGLAISL